MASLLSPAEGIAIVTGALMFMPLVCLPFSSSLLYHMHLRAHTKSLNGICIAKHKPLYPQAVLHPISSNAKNQQSAGTDSRTLTTAGPILLCNLI
jgi:hypothetical protein